jgi:signal transduction histidine kinase
MQRAGILLYDPATRAVRFVGSHGVGKEMIEGVEGTLDETPIAQRALAEDRVVEASEHLEREVPERYARFAEMTTLTCTPVAAGGRWLGVIFADRGGGRFGLSDEDRQTMLTLGRLAALAASVERATRQDERAHRLAERIGLVREIHDRVMQRLFGLVLALGSGEPLSAEERHACHDELQAVLTDLRSALGRPLGGREHSSKTDLRSVIERRAERTPELSVDWPAGVEVPERLEELAQSVFVEALRNCEKHARPTRIQVSVATTDDAFELEIANDGTGSAGPGSGLGLRLLTLEALQQDALVEFGPLPDGRWRVRMVGAVD